MHGIPSSLPGVCNTAPDAHIDPKQQCGSIMHSLQRPSFQGCEGGHAACTSVHCCVSQPLIELRSRGAPSKLSASAHTFCRQPPDCNRAQAWPLIPQHYIVCPVQVPYFGYARADRKSQGRESIAAKLVANMITEAGWQLACVQTYAQQ